MESSINSFELIFLKIEILLKMTLFIELSDNISIFIRIGYWELVTVKSIVSIQYSYKTAASNRFLSSKSSLMGRSKFNIALSSTIYLTEWLAEAISQPNIPHIIWIDWSQTSFTDEFLDYFSHMIWVVSYDRHHIARISSVSSLLRQMLETKCIDA